MADKGNDVLMRVVQDGVAMQPEAQTQISWRVGDGLLETGFTSKSVFELTRFSFNIGKSGSDQMGGEGLEGVSPEELARIIREEAARKAAEAQPDRVVEVEPVTFARLMDSASIQLFTALAGSKTLDSISIIKRKAAGTSRSGETYLRVDFTDVLLISLDWDDRDNVVEEECRFICRKVDMRFRPQKNDGAFGAVIKGTWQIAT